MKEKLNHRRKIRNATLGIIAGSSLIAGTVYVVEGNIGEIVKDNFTIEDYCKKKGTPEKIEECDRRRDAYGPRIIWGSGG